MTDDIRYPSMKQVERLYDSIVQKTGGEHGYLNRSNLKYVLETVKDIGERAQKNQAIIKKASFLLYNIIVLHPFANGNKRTAYELMRLFLSLNGYQFEIDTDRAYQFLLEVASNKTSLADVDNWIASILTDHAQK